MESGTINTPAFESERTGNRGFMGDLNADYLKFRKLHIGCFYLNLFRLER